MTLSDEQARLLLAAARDAVTHTAMGTPPTIAPEEAEPWAQQRRATFVTLRGPSAALRGCIGELRAQRTLIESVRGCAISASTQDPRFPPIAAQEVAGLRIGISILTPAKTIQPEAIEVGRHGLIIERGSCRGVLLPEVATDHGLDAPAFLAATCQKAGLPTDAWREVGTTLHAFETLKLREPR